MPQFVTDLTNNDLKTETLKFVKNKRRFKKAIHQGLSINNVSIKGGRGGVSQILTLANGKQIQQNERILMGKTSLFSLKNESKMIIFT